MEINLTPKAIGGTLYDRTQPRNQAVQANSRTENITLLIDEPGIYCLLGRNGAGKTTLRKSIAGHQNITRDTIRVDGKQ